MTKSALDTQPTSSSGSERQHVQVSYSDDKVGGGHSGDKQVSHLEDHSDTVIRTTQA